MVICSECSKHIPDVRLQTGSFDGGSTVISADRVQIVLKHCEFCGKLVIIHREIQELAR